jgi:hypothetical protein
MSQSFPENCIGLCGEACNPRPPGACRAEGGQLNCYITRIRAAILPFQRLMADNGVTYSMSRSGNACNNTAAKSFFSSLKIEHVIRHADTFDYIERFCNTRRESVEVLSFRPP